MATCTTPSNQIKPAATAGVAHICVGCGTQFAPAADPPDHCPVCVDDRQYIPPEGQRWTTLDELAETIGVRIERDHQLMGVGTDDSFAISQRALLVPAEGGGNIMWDCISVVTDDAVDRIDELGGIDLIAISHPHFYSAMVEWSDAFGGVPIMIHEADRDWIRRTSPALQTWSGDRLEIGPDTTLIHLPGHFDGSSALHWTDPDTERSSLLTGDSLQVAADRRHVSVMHSFPNYTPVGPDVIDDLRSRLSGIRYDDLYGFLWGLNVVGDADTAVDRSFDLYLQAITSTNTPRRPMKADRY